LIEFIAKIKAGSKEFFGIIFFDEELKTWVYSRDKKPLTKKEIVLSFVSSQEIEKYLIPMGDNKQIESLAPVDQA
jgi:hypothetical protein